MHCPTCVGNRNVDIDTRSPAIRPFSRRCSRSGWRDSAPGVAPSGTPWRRRNRRRYTKAPSTDSTGRAPWADSPRNTVAVAAAAVAVVAAVVGIAVVAVAAPC